MEFEAVFIETEMIKAWNVNFLWIMRCGKKNMEIEAVFIETEMIKAWNVNFLKKRGVLKKYRVWSCIYRDRNDHSLKR